MLLTPVPIWSVVGFTGRSNLTLALALLATAVPSHGQQPGKVYRIGYLHVDSPPAPANTTPQQCPVQGTPYWQAFVEGLREYGYMPGQNLVIECRWTEARAERAPAMAAELVGLKPDLLVATGTVQVRAAKQATTEIPILMVGVIDPVRRGLVASLAHPGGNVTGLTDSLMAMEGKRLELLKEAVPKLSRVAVLHYLGSESPDADLFRREEEATARALDLTLQFYRVRDPDEFAGAFTAMTKARAEALSVRSHPFFDWGGHAQRIVDLAAQNRLPAVYPFRVFAKAGGLMSYAVNEPAIRRRLGFYVDRILKGAKPADLPVEQPTTFELVINLKTAKTLELRIPSTLLIQADEVIQ